MTARIQPRSFFQTGAIPIVVWCSLDVVHLHLKLEDGQVGDRGSRQEIFLHHLISLFFSFS